MRSWITISVLLLALASLGLTQQSGSGSGLAAAIAKLPSCATPCLASAIADSPCQLTNATCICSNSQLNSAVEACVLRSCTLRQALTTKNITTTACHAPIRSKVELLRVTNVTLGVISAVCVLARVLYKAVFSMIELGWDDYLILATLICGVPSTIMTDRGTTANGLGRDIWTLPFENITNFIRWFYVMEVLYFFEVAILKLSLLFFFLRIFPARNIKRVIWGTILFDILFGVSFILAGIFQCRPISFYWDRWDGEHVGKCINVNGLGWANAAISISLDVWMLALPLSQVFYLKLAWKKKIGVALMFFVGTFVTIVSILRLQSLIHFGDSHNPTWDQVGVSNWSTIEINVGIMCACMPALRIILMRLFPKLLGSTHSPSANAYYAKYGSHAPGTGKSGNVSSAVGSRLGAGNTEDGLNGITYTKTFEVTRGKGRVEDEEQLVKLDDLSFKGRKVTHSSRSSEVSISGRASPAQSGPTSPRV